ncbi:MAG TPA: MoxR family ATPase [Planctomicrobium sp.]|nr:MoxR family ATPase [Planctomicrobium sp.]
MTLDFEREKEIVLKLRDGRQQIQDQLSKAIVGQRDVIEQVLISLFAGGHCLITGAPGLAKTLLVKSVAQIFHLNFQRVQFTPDLMPADITGMEILEETAEGHRSMKFVPGPIFANVILADEINRTPPKTQAALLEAMQEHQVTAAGKRYPLAPPFFVLATQNPIEMEGTYPLPEAQLDRFMLNVVVNYLPEADEVTVVERTTSGTQEQIEPLFTGEDVLAFQQVVRSVPIAKEIIQYAVRLVARSRPGLPDTPDFVNHYINWGAGTRASQYLVLAAKARALLQGKSHVTLDDLRQMAPPVLRHRVLLNYKAEAEGRSVDDLIQQLIQAVPSPTGK